MQSKIVLGSACSVGRRAEPNEDFVLYQIPRDSYALTNKGVLFAVADGLGGHNAGQVASQLAAQTLASAYYRDASTDLPWSLERAVQAANYVVWDQAMRTPAFHKMGTTLVAAVVRGDQIFVANVGDSRAYLVRSRRLWRITRDHSFAADLVAFGSISSAQARKHPWRKILSRVLGHTSNVRVDLFRGTLVPGDTLFLCTDGLSDFVNERQMLSILARGRNPAESTRALVAMAHRNGSDDNITGLVVHLAPVGALVAPSIAGRNTVALPRNAMQITRVGAIAASKESNVLYALFSLLAFWTVTWVSFLLALISRRH